MKPKLQWLAKKQQRVQETIGPCTNTPIAVLRSAAPYVGGGGLQPQHLRLFLRQIIQLDPESVLEVAPNSLEAEVQVDVEAIDMGSVPPVMYLRLPEEQLTSYEEQGIYTGNVTPNHHSCHCSLLTKEPFCLSLSDPYGHRLSASANTMVSPILT